MLLFKSVSNSRQKWNKKTTSTTTVCANKIETTKYWMTIPKFISDHFRWANVCMHGRPTGRAVNCCRCSSIQTHSHTHCSVYSFSPFICEMMSSQNLCLRVSFFQNMMTSEIQAMSVCVFSIHFIFNVHIFYFGLHLSFSPSKTKTKKKVKCCAYKISQSNSMNSKYQFIHISADELSYHVVLLFHLFSCVVCTVSTISGDSWINKYTHIFYVYTIIQKSEQINKTNQKNAPKSTRRLFIERK